MKRKLLFLLIFIAPITVINAQTILFEEDFESYLDETGIRGIDATNIGDYPASTPFSIITDDLDFSDSGSDYIVISNGQIEMRDLEGEAIMTFNAVDISSQTGDVTLNIGKVDFFMNSATSEWETDDYLDIYYSIDGGNNFVLVPNHMGNGDASHTFILTTTPAEGASFNFSFSEVIDPGTTSSLIFGIVAYNESGSEEFIIDDISVVRGGVTVYTEDFSSYTDPSGIIGSGSDVFQNSGDYPSGVTKWTLTTATSTQLETSDDGALVDDENGTNVLEYNSIEDTITLDTQNIDISGQTDITFGFDINFRTTDYEVEEYVDVYYSIDGGSFVLLQDDGNGHTYSGATINAFVNGGSGEDQQFVHTLNSISGTNFVLRIVAINDSSSEDYQLDNIKVVSGTTLSSDKNTLIGVSIYPNPVKDGLLNIKSKHKGKTDIVLYDVTGREVFKTVLPVSNVIDISNMQSGLYTLIVKQDHKTLMKKIVK